MELEPFWKFDRREQQASQPATRSFIPSPSRRLLLLFALFLRSERESYLLPSHSTPDSSCFPNFDLIPCPVLFLNCMPGATIESSDFRRFLSA